MIQISEETIANIAQDLLDNYIEQYDYEPPITLGQVVLSVENWLLRTIREIEQDPAFYAPGPTQIMNSRVPEFKIEPRCIYFVGGPCRNRTSFIAPSTWR